MGRRWLAQRCPCTRHDAAKDDPRPRGARSQHTTPRRTARAAKKKEGNPGGNAESAPGTQGTRQCRSTGVSTGLLVRAYAFPSVCRVCVRVCVRVWCGVVWCAWGQACVRMAAVACHDWPGTRGNQNKPDACRDASGETWWPGLASRGRPRAAAAPPHPSPLSSSHASGGCIGANYVIDSSPAISWHYFSASARTWES